MLEWPSGLDLPLPAFHCNFVLESQLYSLLLLHLLTPSTSQNVMSSCHKQLHGSPHSLAVTNSVCASSFVESGIIVLHMLRNFKQGIWTHKSMQVR